MPVHPISGTNTSGHLYCQHNPLLSQVSLYFLYASWTRACPELEDKIYEMSDNSLGPTGWLEIQGALAGFNKNYRIPGTTMKYKCNTGFYLADQTNPIQELTCQASRKVDFTNVNMCTRE